MLDEKETHINMSKASDKMQIYTTEFNIMKRLDRYVEESEEWNLVSIGRVKGRIVSKTYEAPRNLLLMRKKKRTVSDEQKLAAAERLKEYWKKKKNEEDDFIDIDEFSFGLEDDEQKINKKKSNEEESNFQPEKTKPSFKKVKDEPELLL